MLLDDLRALALLRGGASPLLLVGYSMSSLLIRTCLPCPKHQMQLDNDTQAVMQPAAWVQQVPAHEVRAGALCQTCCTKLVQRVLKTIK